MSKNILIVDDELDIQSSLSFALKDEGYEVFTASSPKEALERLKKEVIDLGLYDVWFPDGDGMDLLKESQRHYPHVIPVMMSGHGTIELALNSIRSGAYDFLEKPLELDKVLVVLKNALETKSLRDENRRLSELVFNKGQLIGNSTEVNKLKSEIQKAALAQSPVLITGENGTGKELVARLLHQLSVKREGPIQLVNCLSLHDNDIESEIWGSEKALANGTPFRYEGKLELAQKGSVIFDEISVLPIHVQGKLAESIKLGRFKRQGSFKDMPLEARLIATSSHDLSEMVKEGRFREDLFYLLNVVTLKVPTLKQRVDDIEELAEYFLSKISHDYSRDISKISTELLQWMKEYEWPGNARELKNLLERMILMKEDSTILDISDLPEELQAYSPDGQYNLDIEKIKDPLGTLRHLRSQFEKSILEQRLNRMSGNVTKTAESLGIERAHLHRKLKQYGIQVQRGE